jgi:hypothetical protein
VRTAPWAVFLVVLAAFSAEARGRVLWQQGEASLQVSGSLREIPVITHGTSEAAFTDAIAASLPAPTCVSAALFPNCPAFLTVGHQGVWQSLTRLRTHLSLRLTPQLSAELVYDQEFLVGTLRTLERDIAQGLQPSTLVSLDQTILHFDFGGNADEGVWSHLLYRAYLSYTGEHAELIIGSQRIPWGVGRLWSPMDRFNFIPPLAIQPDQTPGVEALDAKWLFSGFTYLEGVLVPQDHFPDSSYALRLHGVWRNTDYSAVAGVFRDAPAGGFDMARNLGDTAVRLETVYTQPRRSVWPIGAPAPGELRGFWQVVASIDRNFDIGNGVYVLAEYLYNGNALGFGSGLAGPLLPFFASTAQRPANVPPDVPGPFVTTASADLLGGSQVVSSGRHESGIELGYDIFPALRSELFTLYDWDGTSAAVVPTIRYDPYPFLELTVGAQFFAGPARSEYGKAQDLGYLLVESFF